MGAAVGVNAPQPITVALTQQGDAARGHQEFEGIVGDQHVARHAGGKAVIDDGEGASRVFFRFQVSDLLGDGRRPGRLVAGLLPKLILHIRHPDTAQVRQLGERLPVLESGR